MLSKHISTFHNLIFSRAFAKTCLVLCLLSLAGKFLQDGSENKQNIE